MNNNDQIIINNKLSSLINNKFKLLNKKDKELLIHYLYLVIEELSKYYYNKHYVDQLLLNDCKDIMSLFVLLFPYYELTKTHLLKDLNDILINNNKNAKDVFNSTYFIDHKKITKKEYFENSLNLIKQTLYKINGKILANWINIFPYTKNNYNKSKEYLNFVHLFKMNSFEKFNCKIGYDTIYGVIKQFLYDDIKKIKWMIYDVEYQNNYIPNIIWLCNKLNIHNITVVDLEKFKKNKQYNEVIENWNEFGNNKQIIKIKSLLLFFYRYKKPNVKEDISNCIQNNFNMKNFDIEKTNEDYQEFNNENNLSDSSCLISLFNSIHFDEIYQYIFECMQIFKYTWYGNMCINDYSIEQENYSNIETPQSFLNKFNNKNITLKTFYNYFKSLTNYQKNDEFISYSYSSNWNELTTYAKEEILKKMNSIDWFNVKGNLRRLYPNENVDKIQQNINLELKNVDNQNITVPKIIFETLVINGIFTYFIYNPINTDEQLMPNKNKDSKKWFSYIKNNIFTHNPNNDYIDSYNFVNNEKYNKITLNNLIESTWYVNFGANWICQIQQFHHFIHNRVMFVTGATGAGKSSVYPFMMLYAQKIINYNNYAKVICTQPRIDPTKGNASRIHSSLGLGNEIKNQAVNYIQYKTSKEDFTDNYSHLTLRFTTDGSLLSLLKDNYILKDVDKQSKNIMNTNILDMLLVDESHENSVNMNIILTLVKFSVYINNQISLGIISATMEYDEIIYRNFYDEIDDNYKYPLSVFSVEKMKEGNIYNRNLMDRRIHMSAPFQTTNYKIEQMEFKESGDDYMNILKTKIFPNSNKGDILLFGTGENDIMKTVKDINNTFDNVLAIPFLSSLDEELKKNIINIGKNEIRNKMNFTKDFVNNNIKNFNNEKNNSHIYSSNHYQQFVIVATNLAEASVTIDSLSFVIDTGKQKKNIFNYDTFKSELKTMPIARPNAMQRKGRAGRTKNGYYFTTYEFNDLQEKIIYPISSEDIINNIVDLITTSNNKKIDKNNDPYLINNIKDILPFLEEQYCYNNYVTNNNSQKYLFNYQPKLTIKKIIYPYDDGGFDIEQLKDEEGIFYLVSPNEDMLERDKNQNIIQKKKNYKNRIHIIFEYLIKLKILNKNYQITKYGSGILNTKQLFISKVDDNKGEMECIDIINLLHCHSFIINDVNKQKYLLHNMILKIINDKQTINIKLKDEVSKLDIKCDFIIQSKIIPKELYYFLNYKNFDNITKNIFIENEEKLQINELFNQKKMNVLDNIIYKITVQQIQKYNLDNEKKKYFNSILFDYNKIKIKFQYIFLNLKKYNIDLNQFDISMYYLHKYDLLSYLMIYYYPNNLLQKLKNVPLYKNYYEQNLTDLYIINNFQVFNKIVQNTLVNSIYLQNFIFYLKQSETNEISNLMFISNKVVELINEKPKNYNMKLLNNSKSYYEILKNINEKFEKYANIILQYN